MAVNPTIEPFKPLLRDLSRWLNAADVRGAIIGGVAASIWGRPRTTRDVDVAVILDEDKWPVLFQAGQQCGFEPRLSDALEFAAQSRVLLMRHVASGIDVDLTFGILAFEHQMLKRAVSFQLNGKHFALHAGRFNRDESLSQARPRPRRHRKRARRATATQHCLRSPLRWRVGGFSRCTGNRFDTRKSPSATIEPPLSSAFAVKNGNFCRPESSETHRFTAFVELI